MARIEFKLPDIGEGVAEGEITSWKVAAGDSVTEDQVMVEVMTDKATVEIGSPVTGQVVEIKAAEGQTVPVGQVIVVLADAAADGKPARPATAGGHGKAAPAPKPAPKPAPAAAPAGGPEEEVDFALPDIGEGVAEGEITKWLVREGDAVSEDQPMLEVMTDKATVEIGSPVDGRVIKILHAEGTTVPVGEVLLVLGTTSGAPRIAAHGGGHGGGKPAPAPRATSAGGATGGGAALAVAPAPSTVVLPSTGLPPRTDGTRRVRAAPAVRRLAREAGIDISRLAGSGPDGRVTLADVRAAANGTVVAPSPGPAAPAAPARPAAPAAAPRAPQPAPQPHALPGDERVPLRGLRKVIAQQMRLSKQTAAHFAYIEEIDVTELVALRAASKEKAAERGVKLTYMPYIMKAACAALRAFPIMNASLDEAAGELVYHGRIHVGVAVDTPNGLIVPVVRDADRKSIVELQREMAELADRARNGKTRPEDIGGGTFTITNAGNIGGVLATPVINVPEVAIMGVHAIRRRPWVVGDEIVIRDIMNLSFSLDHRVVDGAVGARAMNVVKELLENPGLLLLEA